MTDILEQLTAALAAHYLVERELGRGGMATVYLARDLRHDRMVAIKVLDPAMSSTMGSERFLREIRLAAGLQHPHILGVYDSGDVGGLLYFVMPFVEGESLRDQLNRETQLPIEEAVRITLEVADALAFAHSRGVVHRDIKPENILLSGGHAVVADFGIARAASEAGEKLTQTGMAIGTPAYMSPEQAVGDSAVDGRSDIYSLACVLYEMLSGRPPFTGPSARSIMAQHSMEQVPSLQIMRQSIPDDLEDAILRAMEKVPADRFPTASQFSRALSGSTMEISSPRLSRVRTGRTGRFAAARGSSWKKYRWVVAAGIPLVLIGGWVLVARKGNAAGAAADAGASRVAVLYFDDRSGGELRHVADGFTDALIHDLSAIPALKVISRNGVQPYRDQPVSPDSIARALNVGTLVDGTVEARGEMVRVTVSLINAISGDEIASTRLERPRTEVLDLQGDITEQVSTFLRRRLGKEIQLSQRRGETGNAQAWETLQRAQELEDDATVLQGAGDIAAASAKLAEADALAARAADLDDDWSRPVVRRGWIAYRQARLPGVKREDMPRWLAEATGHAEQGLVLRGDDADALELRGTAGYLTWLLNLEPNQARAAQLHQGAQRDLEAAVTANPQQASAWSTLSHLRMGASENALGKLAALKAYEADPFLTTADATIWRLFQSSLDLEDRVESTHWCEEGFRRFPTDPRFTECKLWLAALSGTRAGIPGTWETLRRFQELTPATRRDLATRRGTMILAMGLARAGLADSARRVALGARTGTAVDETRDLSLYEAIVQTMLNDRDQAIRLLSVYLATNPQMRASLARDDSWYFRDLRTDPRYRSMIGSGN